MPWSIVKVVPFLLAALLGPVTGFAQTELGDELTSDWAAQGKCQGRMVCLFAQPIPNGSVLQISFYARRDEELSIGYSDVDVHVYDDRGDEVPLKAPPGYRGSWGILSMNSFGGSADGFYRMILKTGRHPSTAKLTYRGEKCTFAFAVRR